MTLKPSFKLLPIGGVHVNHDNDFWCIGPTEKLRTHGYYVLKVKQGPIRDPCTRAHGKLATPLEHVICIIGLGGWTSLLLTAIILENI